MIPASYIEGTRGKYLSLPERPRFLKCSDGQVLDRLNGDPGHGEVSLIAGLRMCNEADFGFKPLEMK